MRKRTKVAIAVVAFSVGVILFFNAPSVGDGFLSTPERETSTQAILGLLGIVVGMAVYVIPIPEKK